MKQCEAVIRIKSAPMAPWHHIIYPRRSLGLLHLNRVLLFLLRLSTPFVDQVLIFDILGSVTFTSCFLPKKHEQKWRPFPQQLQPQIDAQLTVRSSVSWASRPPWSLAVRSRKTATVSRSRAQANELRLLFKALGAAYGTAKSGCGIAAMAVMKPEYIMKSVIPVVMAGIIAIYGLVVAVLIAGNIDLNQYSLFK